MRPTTIEPSDDVLRMLADDDGSFGRSVVSAWPEPLAEEALNGLAGDIVRAVLPHTEASAEALLLQLLAGFGNTIGRTSYFMAEADQHFGNLFVVLIGETAKGRKGTSWGIVSRLLSEVDDRWFGERLVSGLSSGEGLIWHVRDPIEAQEPIKEHGRVVDYQRVIVDEGIKDKRLLVIEPEFARVLKVAERESNTLSATVRQAWDTGRLAILTKTKAATATGAHISLVGHITRRELQAELTGTAAANGFANRFLWTCVRRSKLLPEGGAWASVDSSGFVRRLREAVDFARRQGEMRRDKAARQLWIEVYPQLSEGREGMAGALTSRSEAQTMRLAMLYALLDRSPDIRIEHLAAALAVWEYCERSVLAIFGDLLGDGLADEILRALRARPDGMTRTMIRDLRARNASGDGIASALDALRQRGLARSKTESTEGRSAERWFAVRPNDQRGASVVSVVDGSAA
jgi:hypothetical protein